MIEEGAVPFANLFYRFHDVNELGDMVGGDAKKLFVIIMGLALIILADSQLAEDALASFDLEGKSADPHQVVLVGEHHEIALDAILSEPKVGERRFVGEADLSAGTELLAKDDEARRFLGDKSLQFVPRRVEGGEAISAARRGKNANNALVFAKIDRQNGWDWYDDSWCKLLWGLRG